MTKTIQSKYSQMNDVFMEYSNNSFGIPYYNLNIIKYYATHIVKWDEKITRQVHNPKDNNLADSKIYRFFCASNPDSIGIRYSNLLFDDEIENLRTYVILGEEKDFREGINELSLAVTLDVPKKKRFFLVYTMNEVLAKDIIPCDWSDWDNLYERFHKAFPVVNTIYGVPHIGVAGHMPNPFNEIGKLRGDISTLATQYICEVNDKGYLHGTDSKIFVKEYLAWKDTSGAIRLSNKHLDTVHKQIEMRRNCDSEHSYKLGERKYINRRLTEIVEQKVEIIEPKVTL